MKGYGSSKLTAVVILGMTVLLWQSAQADTTLLSGSFNAAEAEYHLGSFTFQAPVDGQLLIRMDNPDGSADGEIAFTNVTTGLRYNDGLFYGTTDYPLFNPQTWPRARITQGRVHSLYVLPVRAGWGLCSYDVSYSSWRGTQNSGTNSITITYIPRPLTTAGAKLLVSLTSDPSESNSETAAFDAGKGGWLLLDLLQSGTGGGNHSVYLNGRGIEYNQVGHPPRVMGVHTAIEVAAGTHNLMIRHEDDGWFDNTGVRRTDVYFIPYPFVTYYVDADAKGANDGSSWADAYNYLQNALTVALYGDEIRVAQGIYRPTDYFLPPPPPPPMGSSNDQDPVTSAADRTATFQLVNGVVIKGGYAGFGEPNADARDIELYETILSGDLKGNDIDIANPEDLLDEPTRAENSFHVVTGSGTDGTAVLDGFTITGGNANGPWQQYLNQGGGMYNSGGDLTLTNCTFSGNSASAGGGGIHNYHSNLALTNCTFSGNFADGSGGGMHNGGSRQTVTLTNCTFSRNSAGDGGGLRMSDNFSPPTTLTNCIFTGNRAAKKGGGISSSGCFLTRLTNCIFSGNSAGTYGAGMDSWYSTPILTNCTFTGNSADKYGGGLRQLSDRATLTNCILWDNVDLEGTDESAQINKSSTAKLFLNYNCIQGWTGNLGGTGNNGADPCFVQPHYFRPIVYWKLDEGSGTTAYDSVGDNHGIIYGAQWTTGQIDGALDFDGVDDYVGIPWDESLANVADNFTILLWAQPLSTHQIDPESNSGTRGTSGQKYAISARQGDYHWGSGHAGAGISIGTNGISVYEHAADYMPAVLVWSGSVSEFTHVAVVYRDKQPRLYIDGESKKTGLQSSKIVHILSNIGGHRYGYFNGLIDDVHIYNRALSADEIRQHYLRGLNGQGYPDANTPDYHLLEDSPCINTGDPDYIAGPNEIDLDGKPRIIGGRIDMGAYEFNHKPVADAGPDQTVEAQAPWGATVTLDGSGSSDADCTPGTIDDINDFNWCLLDPCDPNADIFLGSGVIIDCNLAIGEHIIFLEVIDRAGASDTDEVTIIVQDTTPPDINCPADVTLEYPADTSPSATGKATATDTCGDVTIRCRNRIIPGCGNTETIERTWIAADECGNESSCMQTIKVVDTTPPEFTLFVTPTMLWPPNHKMAEITPSWTVSDECDPSPDVSLVSIVANEGDDIIGDGHTSNDIQIDDDGSIFVRSERSGTNTGRIYTITYRAVDDCGNTTVRSATVSIPHDFKLLARMCERWLWRNHTGNLPEDLNGDGIVNLKDIAVFANNWIQ